jgi:hypothetical protein
VRYALLICDDEFEPQGPEEIGARPDHVAWIEFMKSRGVTLLGGQRLRTSDDATSVRARGDEVLISDGPFAETKEQIGGFALIECADLDEAIEVAARHPFAARGVVEIRPVWEA